MTGNWRPRIVCHLLWDRAFAEGPQLAHEIYSRLCRDITHPISRGIGIPIFFHCFSDPSPGDLAERITLDAAESTVVLPFVDDSMAASDSWTAALETLDLIVPPAPQGPHRLFPVAFTPNSYNVSKTISRLNFLRLQAEAPERRAERLIAMITHELCRLLLRDPGLEYGLTPPQAGEGTAPVRLFLSHAKQDGLTIVAELLQYLAVKSPVESYYDVTDIPSGIDFQKELERAVQKSALLVTHTDLYATRFWCRREVLVAKKYQCPLWW